MKNIKNQNFEELEESLKTKKLSKVNKTSLKKSLAQKKKHIDDLIIKGYDTKGSTKQGICL